MKTQIQKIIGLLTISSLLFVSCETVDFGDENLNPNAISKANTGALITGAMRNIPSIVSSVNPLLLSQQVSEITYNEDSCYETIQWNFDSFYSGPLMDLQTVININNSENAADYSSSGSVGMQKGVAHLLRVYMLQAMTNMWGAIPYSEALQGVDVLKPSFDDQSAVYAGLMTEIDAALGFLDGGGLSGDFMFNGNAAKWAQFGNTMKMVMALRMADADPSAAEAAFKSAVAGGVLTSNADNIHYPYTTSDDNDSPWQDRFQSREDFAHSPSKVSATTNALKIQYKNRKLIALLELHTFSSLNEDFIGEYRNSLKQADTRILFYDPKAVESKGLKNISVQKIKDSFNDDNMIVFSNSDQLKTYLFELSYDNTNLLFMSSGNYASIDLEVLNDFVKNN
ncbi:SusD/RagB family nutrient-binding outer membrane lipoprotein [Flavobacteriaceae bacterium]|nr:SusD/RagB family nutrient-binding outer membrane lipoprotein [Flavobacteriaceae bacterium]